jgi:hypothetical protein
MNMILKDRARFLKKILEKTHLEIDSEGWLKTKLYDKRDDFNFPIVKFPFTSICRNIPAAPAFGIYISQLIRYYADLAVSALSFILNSVGLV